MFNVYAKDYRQFVDQIPLGNQGEENARCLVVDITDVLNEFGSTGTLEVRNRRPGDSLPYVVRNASIISATDADGGTAYYAKWVLDNIDTAKAGMGGSVQVQYSINDVDCYTWIFKYHIMPSLGVTGEVPEPWVDIMEDMAEYARQATNAAEDAASSAAAAGTSEASAEESRTVAESSASLAAASAAAAGTSAQEAKAYSEDAGEYASAAAAHSGGDILVTDMRDNSQYKLGFAVTTEGQPAVALTEVEE